MKPSLTGKPLNEDDILAMQCREILFLKNTAQQPVPMSTVIYATVAGDESLVVEASVAINRLQDAGKIEVMTIGQRVFIKLASTADEAQGSTSRLAVGAGVEVGQTSAPRILPDPLARLSIVKKSEEVHLDFCFTDCGRVASGKCECGNPVCSVHRYNAQGDREPNGGFCVMCSAVPQDSTDVSAEMVRNIGGRA